MTTAISAPILEKAWAKALKAVLITNQLVLDEVPFYELRNLRITYSNAFEIDAPHYRDIFGTDALDYIQRVYAPGGDPGTNRNYYKLIHDQNGHDQVKSVIERLTNEPLSRSATVVLSSAGAWKQPCVMEVNFCIRQDRLKMTALFKSSDLAKKFIPDMVELSKIHRKISQALNIARGDVSAFILCAQLYATDKKKAQEAIDRSIGNRYFKTDATIENWDKEARYWDANIRKSNFYVNIENGYVRFLSFFKKRVPAASNETPQFALDSGCGTGAMSVELKRKGYHVSGVDISPEMLRYAHKNPPSIKYTLANSLDLPYPDARFDVVCSRGVLISHVGAPYVDTFLEEHFRVLRPGGLFLFDFITHFEKREISNRRRKASMNFAEARKRAEEKGFEVLMRSGEDSQRVNALLCHKPIHA